jgi:DNA-damage-inducible protein D
MKKINSPNEPAHHIAVFQETTIRRVWHNEEWWFAIVDVVSVLTDSADPRQYIKKMRSREPELDANWGTTCTPLAMQAADGKQRETNCANTEGLFRIIQSIPSPKAEPFKRWLAQVGYERVKEIENPELASARARELYQAKGYPQAWIEKRLRSISVRGELTDEWKARGVAEGKECSILTAEIARATFGVTPVEHSQLKGLDVVKTGNKRVSAAISSRVETDSYSRPEARSLRACSLSTNRYRLSTFSRAQGVLRRNFKLELTLGSCEKQRIGILRANSSQP